jgi:methenyltetrahydromethanopterin cyclohydrolase
MLFSPARIALTNVKSGRTFEAGRFDAGVLRQSLLA